MKRFKETEKQLNDAAFEYIKQRKSLNNIFDNLSYDKIKNLKELTSQNSKSKKIEIKDNSKEIEEKNNEKNDEEINDNTRKIKIQKNQDNSKNKEDDENITNEPVSVEKNDIDPLSDFFKAEDGEPAIHNEKDYKLKLDEENETASLADELVGGEDIDKNQDKENETVKKLNQKKDKEQDQENEDEKKEFDIVSEKNERALAKIEKKSFWKKFVEKVKKYFEKNSKEAKERKKRITAAKEEKENKNNKDKEKVYSDAQKLKEKQEVEKDENLFANGLKNMTPVGASKEYMKNIKKTAAKEANTERKSEEVDKDREDD